MGTKIQNAKFVFCIFVPIRSSYTMFRIAPTPSGFLHTGNAFSFLLTEKLAREHNAGILLRIDDSDAERKRTEFIRDIFETIGWLGIAVKGPKDEFDFETNWSQHRRMDRYTAALEKLRSDDLVYACSCTRKSLLTEKCRCAEKFIGLDEEDVAWRLKIPENTGITFTDSFLGEKTIMLSAESSPVIRRKNKLASYQLISLADDVHFGISHIVRGVDLLESTAVQLFLAGKLGETFFLKSTFYHHPLIEDEQREKLSKSQGATSVRSLRLNNFTPGQFRSQFESWVSENKL
jgi:glutamyl/glutaminyl-tRNA synthetase